MKVVALALREALHHLTTFITGFKALTCAESRGKRGTISLRPCPSLPCSPPSFSGSTLSAQRRHSMSSKAVASSSPVSSRSRRPFPLRPSPQPTLARFSPRPRSARPWARRLGQAPMSPRVPSHVHLDRDRQDHHPHDRRHQHLPDRKKADQSGDANRAGQRHRR